MRRLCERPGCSRLAEAAYTVDVGRLQVSMARLAADGDDHNVLCAQHATAMSVPRGWTLDDLRELAPPLFRLPTPERLTARRRHPAAGTLPRQPAEQLQLVVDRAEPEQASPPRRAAAAVAVAGPAPAGRPKPGRTTPERTRADQDTSAPPSVRVLDDDSGDETKVLSWTPKFDETDDLDGLLQATSPLLSRAFKARPADR